MSVGSNHGMTRYQFVAVEDIALNETYKPFIQLKKPPNKPNLLHLS